MSSSNILTLYHGSPFIIDEPEYGKGNPYGDYGQAFYCTMEMELAKELSVKDSSTINGYCNEYEIDVTGLSILRLDELETLHWVYAIAKGWNIPISSAPGIKNMAMLSKFYCVDVDAYDIIIGNRVDDSHTAFVLDFINNLSTLETLEEEMYYGDVGAQYVIKSSKAFNRLEHKSSSLVLASEYYQKYKDRENDVIAKYNSLKEYSQNRNLTSILEGRYGTFK